MGKLTKLSSDKVDSKLKTSRKKKRIVFLGIFALIVFLLIAVIVQQLVLNKRVCYGLSCPTGRGLRLKIFPIDARDSNDACKKMGYKSGSISCVTAESKASDCPAGTDAIRIPIGKGDFLELGCEDNGWVCCER